MNELVGSLIFYGIIGLVVFLICVLMMRWIFRIDERLDYQRKQYMMIRQIAGKLGVDEMKILEIDDPYLARRKKAAALKNAK